MAEFWELLFIGESIPTPANGANSNAFCDSRLARVGRRRISAPYTRPDCNLLVAHLARQRVFFRLPAPTWGTKSRTFNPQLPPSPPNTVQRSIQPHGNLFVRHGAEQCVFGISPGVRWAKRRRRNAQLVAPCSDGCGSPPNPSRDLGIAVCAKQSFLLASPRMVFGMSFFSVVHALASCYFWSQFFTFSFSV